jgi:putrescine importer
MPTKLDDGQRVTLKRSLRHRDLILYGIILIQPTAPMPVFGVIYQESRGYMTG